MGGYRAVAHGMPSSFYIMTWHRPRGIRLQALPLFNVLLWNSPSTNIQQSEISKRFRLTCLSQLIYVLIFFKIALLLRLWWRALNVCRWRVPDHASVSEQRRGGWTHPLHHVRAGQPLPEIVYEEDESLLHPGQAVENLSSATTVLNFLEIFTWPGAKLCIVALHH